MDLIYLSNIIENGRQKYYELIRKYPKGNEPDEWRLLVFYLNIRENQCCYVDQDEPMLMVRLYFAVNYLENCLLLPGQRSTITHPYQ